MVPPMLTNALALSRLLVAERPSLVRWLARMVGETAAEDVAQSLYLRVQRVADHPPIVNKRSFLFRLARNLAIDHIRAETRRERLFEGDMDARDIPSAEPSAETHLIDRERIRRMTAAVEHLPFRCRQVFILIKFEELSVAETARRLSISQDMVRKHVRHALLVCHQSLTEPSS